MIRETEQEAYLEALRQIRDSLDKIAKELAAIYKHGITVRKDEA